MPSQHAMEKRKKAAAVFGCAPRMTFLYFKDWVHLARKFFKLYLSCWESDKHGGWTLKPDCISDLQEVREKCSLLLLLNANGQEKTPRKFKEMMEKEEA